MKNDPMRLQRILGYSFQNPMLLKEALMHKSFAMENQILYDNQRLEFLGDAVLQIILTRHLFHRYPDLHEGDLTKIRSALANQDSLAKLARSIELGKNIMFGKGELETGGTDRDSTLCDAFEALLAAVMLDSDEATAEKLFLDLMAKHFPEPSELLKTLNPKGALQEYTQKNYSMAPVYETLSVSGEDHNPVFDVAISLRGIRLAAATANKRKNAEILAAREALEFLQREDLPEELKRKESVPC